MGGFSCSTWITREWGENEKKDKEAVVGQVKGAQLTNMIEA